MAAPPMYRPTSLAAGVGGPIHHFVRFRTATGVSYHPLQRSGQVGVGQHQFLAAQSATEGAEQGVGGSGNRGTGAAWTTITWPPIAPNLPGNARDPRVMVS